MIIPEGALVLFQGDSITDAGWLRETPTNLGRGYAMMAAAQYGLRYPERDVRFLNRGISGNRAADLLARWQTDCLDLRPDLLSIYIGINDTWRRYDQGWITTAAEFEGHYTRLLDAVCRELPATRLVLVEPFVLPVPEDRQAWREDLDPKIAVVRKLALAYRAALVPLDGLFAQAACRREPSFWAADGVHPSPAGHALIARAWLDAVEAM
jgi:lysophospholipase L1-like esterase